MTAPKFHVDLDGGEVSYLCLYPNCDYFFSTLQGILVHIARVHKGKRKKPDRFRAEIIGNHTWYICQRCGPDVPMAKKQFYDLPRMLGHLATEHAHKKAKSKPRRAEPELKPSKMTPAEQKKWAEFLQWQRNSAQGARPITIQEVMQFKKSL